MTKHRTAPKGARSEVARLRETNAELLEALKAFLDVAKESHGIDGYHLNGNIATWDELDLIDAACIAIAKAEGTNT